MPNEANQAIQPTTNVLGEPPVGDPARAEPRPAVGAVILDFRLLDYRGRDPVAAASEAVRPFRLTPYIVLQVLRAAGFLPSLVRLTSRYRSREQGLPSARALVELPSRADAADLLAALDGRTVELMSPVWVRREGGGPPLPVDETPHADDPRQPQEEGGGQRTASFPCRGGDPAGRSIRWAAQTGEARFALTGFLASPGQFPAWLSPDGRVLARRNSDLLLELSHRRGWENGGWGPCFRAAYDARTETETGKGFTAPPDATAAEPPCEIDPGLGKPNRKGSAKPFGKEEWRRARNQGGSPREAPCRPNSPIAPSPFLLPTRSRTGADPEPADGASFPIDPRVDPRARNPRRRRSPSPSSTGSETTRDGSEESRRARPSLPPSRRRREPRRRPREASEAALGNDREEEGPSPARETCHRSPVSAPPAGGFEGGVPVAFLTALCYDAIGPLPLGWRPVYSVEYQQTYYVHRHPLTGVETTTWERPELPSVIP